MRNKKHKLNFIAEALDKRTLEHRFRTLKPVKPIPGTSKVEVDGKVLINFCSNDYLGLASHPQITERSVDFTKQFGTGSKASRLVSGTLSIHEELEEKFAEVFNLESVLLFNSGFQANTTILSSLADRNSLILVDKKCHNSLIQGALLSRATFKRFNHNDLEHLETLLSEAQSKNYNRIWIVSETVFSMDGDQSDILGQIKLAQKYDALLYSDDAHALGVLGENGLGLNYGQEGIDISIGTFGKAFGSFGAFVGCSKEIKEYLINFCPGFIYTTSLPPSVIGALYAALEIIPGMHEERRELDNKISNLINSLNDMGFNTLGTHSQIIPILIGSEEETVKLSRFLEDRGIWASAIRPPTVEQGTSRIRITITASHSDNDVNQLLSVLREWKER